MQKDDMDILLPEKIKKIQKSVGSFLYYRSTTNIKFIKALKKLTIRKSRSTKNKE